MPTCATVRSYDDHPSFEVLEPRLLLNGTVDLGLSAAEVPEVPPGYLLECDANGDGRVDGGDLGIFQQNYDPVGIGENIYQMGDWDLDGKIDGGDLSLWQQFYDPLGSDGLQNIGSGEFTTRAPGPGEVAINTAGYLISSPGYYILTADITAEASAIGINCGNVTLDLNGHTITWGTDAVLSDGVVTYNSWQSGNVGHAGIMSPSRPDRTDDFPGAFGWNPSRPNVVIGNGRIVQGNGSGLAYSHGIDLGGCQGAELHDLIIEVDAPDTQGLLVGRDADVHHMTFLHGGTHVTNRHQQLAVVVLSAGGEIHNCDIDGGPQVGVKALDDSVVHHNRIRHNVTVTNGYGVQGYGQDNVHIFNNVIMPYNGRGIHLSEHGQGWHVHNNYVEVREHRNGEYSTLQTHGIKLENNTNSSVHDNVVLSVSSDGGQPTPLNFGIPADAGNQVYNNTFIALTVNDQPAYSIYMTGSNGQGTETHDNVFHTNDYAVTTSWNGAESHTFRRCRFRKVNPSDSVTFMRIWNGYPHTALNQRFIDCVFSDGIQPGTYWAPYPTTSWRSDADYAIGWSLTLDVTDEGTALPGADVVITDEGGATVATGQTDVEGRFVADLLQFKIVYLRSTGTATSTNYADYSITVSHGGDVRQFLVSPVAAMEVEVDLAETGLLILTPVDPLAGEVNDEYRVKLSATGSETVSWSVIDGTLPPGLAITDGRVIGTPTAAGSYAFTLQAWAGGQEAVKEITIRVAQQPETPCWRQRVPIHRDGVGSLSLGSGEPATEPTVAGETSICAAEANASPETYAGVDPNGDGKVDGADLAFWQRHYDPLGANDNTWFHGDWNLDGRVDGGDLALWQRGYDPVGSPVVGEYPWFNGFCREYFGAEKEELVYETFGSDASFDATGEWQHVSVQSAVFAFETTLPTVTTVNFGETSDYGYMTTPSERPFYLHQHTLRDILPETTYHYRFVAMDERGNVIVGEDRTFTTGSLLEVISISVTHLSVPYALDRAGAIYVLVNDVTADSTAFNIMAGNVTFDLNGHTVTYDQVGGAYDPTATLSYFPNWMIAGPHGVRTGWSADGSRVLNGTIIQGAGSNGEGANPVVADDLADFAGMTVIYHGSQVTGLYGDAGHVHHNVIVDEGTEITDRHNGIKAIQAAGAPVHHNLIKRCRQNGIKVYDNDDVYKNEVYVDSWATNSYAIMCYTHGNSVIHDNWIFGGGYNVVGIGTLGTGARDIEVYDNFVHLQATEPTDRWPEYGAISGVRGMRITWFADNVTYHDNVFAVYACDGGTVRGLWYCPATDVTNVLFIHNTVKAVAQNVASNQSGAIVINGWSPTNAAAGIFRENRVISNFCNVCIGDSYGGGTNAVFIGNTFVRIGDRANYRTIEIGDDWQVCSGHRFIDSLFEGGAGYDHVLFESGNTRNFTVEWTLTVNTSPHSNVTIRDRDDATVFSGSSGVTGSVSVVLVQYRQEPTGRIVATPHTVTVEKDGRTASAPVTMDRKRTLTLYPPTVLTMPLELVPLAGAEALIVE